MAIQNLIYKICDVIPSCLNGRAELQPGERARITLEPKNPLWPADLIAELISVERVYGGRIYTFQFDDEDLNGGPLFDGCDIAALEPYCCCDEIRDHLIAEDDGEGRVITHNFDGTDVCSIACPPEGTAPGTYPHLQPDGSILWQGSAPDSDTTYILSGAAVATGYQITLTGSDGSVQDVIVPTDPDTTYVMTGVPATGGFNVVLTGSDGSTQTTFVPTPNTTYVLTGAPNAVSGYDVTLTSSTGVVNTVTVPVSPDTTYALTATPVTGGTNITLTPSTGAPTTVFAPNTTYSMGIYVDLGDGFLEYRLNGSDGTSQPFLIPIFNDGVPTPGTYAPDPMDGLITIPMTKNDSTTGGMTLPLAPIIIDTNGLGVTYTFTQDYGDGGEIEITLAGTDGSEQIVTIPYSARLNTYPVAGTYTPVGNIVTIPIVEYMDNGPEVPAGNMVLDLSSLTGDAVTGFDVVGNNYVITTTSGSFNVPITRLVTNVPGQVTIIDAQGNSQTIYLNPGSLNVTAQAGDDPCSRRINHVDATGAVQSFPGFGWVNQIIVDPSSTQHTGVATGDTFTLFGIIGENGGANGGEFLPANGGETRGAGPDFSKLPAEKDGCAVVAELKTGRRVGSTTVVDKDFYADLPRTEREDRPFQTVADIPAGVRNASEVIRVQAGSTDNIALVSGASHAINLTETHTVGAISLNGTAAITGRFRISGCPDAKAIACDNGTTTAHLGDIVGDAASPATPVSFNGGRVDLKVGRVFTPVITGYGTNFSAGVTGRFEFDTIDAEEPQLGIHMQTGSNMLIKGRVINGAINRTDQYSGGVYAGNNVRLNLDVDTINARGYAFRTLVANETYLKAKLLRSLSYFPPDIGTPAVLVYDHLQAADRRSHYAHVDRITMDDDVQAVCINMGNGATANIYNCGLIKKNDFYNRFIHSEGTVYGPNEIRLHNCFAYSVDPTAAVFSAQQLDVFVFDDFKTNVANLNANTPIVLHCGTITLNADVPSF